MGIKLVHVPHDTRHFDIEMDGVVVGTLTQMIDENRLRNQFYQDKIFRATINVYYGTGRCDYTGIECRAGSYEDAITGAINKASAASATFWDNAKQIRDKYRGN